MYIVICLCLQDNLSNDALEIADQLTRLQVELVQPATVAKVMI